MKLEVGKFYRARNGSKWECVAVWTKPGTGGYQATCICGDHYYGSFRMDGGYEAGDDQFELASEWREPVKVCGWVNVYPTAALHPALWPSQDAADAAAFGGRIACVYVEGTEV